MKHTLTINSAIFIAALAFSGVARAQQDDRSSTKTSKTTTTNSRPDKGNVSAADKSFMKEAAKGGMMEVAMGRTAEKNATSPEVKKFGARMVTDHSNANTELKSIAAEKAVDLPQEKPAGKWTSDEEYMAMMVKDHEKDLALFQKEAKQGSDQEVKTFAGKTAEIISKHLQMAKDIDGKLK